MLFLWVLTCFLIITIFCIAVYYTKREIKQLESFSVSEESSTLGNSSAFIVLYDVSKNLGLNLRSNVDINFISPTNSIFIDSGNDFYSNVQDQSNIVRSIMSSKEITYHIKLKNTENTSLASGGLFENNVEILKDVFKSGVVIIDIQYNGTNGIWILTSSGDIYAYDSGELTKRDYNIGDKDRAVYISGHMDIHERLFFITEKGSLYLLGEDSESVMISNVRNRIVLRVSQFGEHMCYVTSDNMIFVWSGGGDSKNIASSSNSLLTINATHAFYVKELEETPETIEFLETPETEEPRLCLFKINLKDRKEEQCFYGELYPGKGLGGGCISDISILETLKSGNLIIHVKTQRIECSKTQNYVEAPGEKTDELRCICKEHHRVSEEENNTCIPCNKSEKRINTVDSQLNDQCVVLDCSVHYNHAKGGGESQEYQNSQQQFDRTFPTLPNEFDYPIQTDSNYQIISFDNERDELCSAFVYGGNEFTKKSPYMQLTSSGYMFREADYIEDIDILTPHLSEVAAYDTTNMKNMKMDDIDKRAIVQNEVNTICFENKELSGVLGEKDLCPRNDTGRSFCMLGQFLHNDDTCDTLPVGSVINTDKKPTYDSFPNNGHRETQYINCLKDTFANGTECTECDLGSFAGPNSAECIACKPGERFDYGRNRCSRCPAGEFSDENALCQKCEDGKIAPPGSSNCVDCEPDQLPSSDGGSCLTCDFQKNLKDYLKSLDLCVFNSATNRFDCSMVPITGSNCSDPT
tara:strand:+ start:2378 stop:4633 length:2256 start_codon:yes stop_codon:yes gene_type:complete